MKTKCEPVEHPNIMPGWGCCQCRTYNGIQRNACKHCGHERCDEPEEEDIESEGLSKDLN